MVVIIAAVKQMNSASQCKLVGIFLTIDTKGGTAHRADLHVIACVWSLAVTRNFMLPTSFEADSFVQRRYYLKASRINSSSAVCNHC